jgi:hypothetical protein
MEKKKRTNVEIPHAALEWNIDPAALLWMCPSSTT